MKMLRLLASLTLLAAVQAEDSFTLAVIPDAQMECEGDRFGNRMRWLLANREALNIRLVLQVGDLQNWDTPGHEQYVHQSAGLRILDDAGMPYVMCIGNHDTAATKEGGSAAPGNVNANLRNTATWNSFYPPSRFKLLAGVCEPGKSDNAFHLMRAGDVDWLILNLELWPRTAVVAWARTVVESHPHHNVIVITHCHLSGGDANHQCTVQTNNGGYGDNSPQFVFDQVLKPFANVRMVLSGHVGTHGSRVDTGASGNRIHQFLACYHSGKDNPTRLLTINTKTGMIASRVYGQTSGKEYADGSAFTLDGATWVQPAPAAATP